MESELRNNPGLKFRRNHVKSNIFLLLANRTKTAENIRIGLYSGSKSYINIYFGKVFRVGWGKCLYRILDYKNDMCVDGCQIFFWKDVVL